MEDQGKRLLFAVMAAFAVMMAWQLLFPPETPDKKPDEPQVGEQTPAEQTGDGTQPDTRPDTRPDVRSGAAAGRVDSAPGQDGAPGQDSAPAVVEPVERGPEQLFTLEADELRAVFTTYGGNLKSWELQGSKFFDYSKPNGGQIDMVRTPPKEEWLPLAIGFENADLVPAHTEWKGTQVSNRELEFQWSLARDDGTTVITKRYRLIPEDYLLQLDVEVANQTGAEQKLKLQVSMFGYQDPDVDTEGGWTRVEQAWKVACYIDGDVATSSFKALEKAPKKRHGRLGWGGFLHSYFLIAAAPELEKGDRLGCNGYPLEGLAGGMRVDLVFPEIKVGPGNSLRRSLNVYLGPKYLDKLESIESVIGHDPGFGAAVDLGWFEIIARPLLWLLQWFQSFLGNWGLAIICLTIVVKLVTLPWTTKSMRSMKAMGKLKPKIEALQKKYKDDKQRQQVELMNLYKAHGVNPLLGCLPMLLQMPIWIALYRMLMAAAELYQAPFIPGWINDLTAPDQYYILPVALTVMMFLQSKLSPTQPDSTQQKIMMYGLPMMFGVFSFFFPSGLTLYMFTNTLLTAGHHVWMNRTGNEPAGTTDKERAGGDDRKPAERVADDDDDDDDDDDEPSGGASESGASASTRPSKSRSRGKAGPRKRSGKRKRGGK